MLLSIIKDFNATYQSILTTQEIQNHDFLQISWKICIFFFIKLWSKIVYIFTFQWLRDFAYFPISLPQLNEKMTILPPLGTNSQESSTLVSRAGENMFDWFVGTPSSSWSLRFLSPTWFDHLTRSNQFLTDTDNFKLNHFLGILIILGFSSFFNSFLINSPLSIANIWCLRYSISHNFKTSCISILGVVIGELAFMLSLILPPPFIQITLIYLESVWPYIFGISLIIWVIFDSVNNSSSVHFFSKARSRESIYEVGNNSFWKILRFSFLLSFTEQACCFSYFGSLNLSSTSNFLDTYLFAASSSPAFLIVSCLGFVLGSFLTLIIFNYFFTQFIYFVIWSSQWPINLVNSLFLPSPHRRSGDLGEKPQKKITGYVVFVFKNMANFFTQNIKTPLSQTRIQSSAIPSFAGIKKDGMLHTPSAKSVNSPIEWIQRNVKGILNLIFYPLFSRKSSIYGAPDQRLGAGGKKNSSLDEFKTRSPIFARKPGSKARHYFVSFFNKINDWYETSPFYIRSLPSTTSSNSMTNFNTIQPSIDSGVTQWNDSSLQGRVSSDSEGIRGNNRKKRNKPISLQTLLKLDKFLLTCLITFAFTTIPYYSCDYLFNQFIGITPKDEFLNNYNLRVNYTDYSSLLGTQLSDKTLVLNTDVSLYDRAHFMYAEWPTSFESLNYQGELFWNNLRDHRRQKRTRRSTRVKFKNLKTKIATSWKAFKRNDSLSLPSAHSDFRSNEQKNGAPALPRGPEDFNDSSFQSQRTTDNRVKNNQLIFSKLFPGPRPEIGAPPISSESEETTVPSDFFGIRGNEEKFSPESKKTYGAGAGAGAQQGAPAMTWGPEAFSQGVRESDLKSGRESLGETFQNLSSVTFKDLSSVIRVAKSYSKNWKKVITEKYYQNPIYKILLSNDLKNFLKREPETQQLTFVQEKELDFLRIKMCHYFDTLRFYFKMKEKIKPYSESNGAVWQQRENVTSLGAIKDRNPQANFESSNPESDLQSKSLSLKDLPFQFKSMMSLNYHQRFKGSLNPIRELFQISSPNSFSTVPIDKAPNFDKSLFNEFSMHQNSFFHEESSLNPSFRPSGPAKMNSKTAQIEKGSAREPKEHSQRERIYNLFGSSDPFYVGWDKNLRKFILTSRFLSRTGSLNEQGPRDILEARRIKNLPSKPIGSPQNYRQLSGDGFPPISGPLRFQRNLRGPPFFRFLRNRKERQDVFASAPQGQSKKTRVFLRAINGSEETTERKIEDLSFLESEETLVSGEKERSSSFLFPKKKISSGATGGKTNQFNLYRTYSSWPLFKSQLINSMERPYSVMYETYYNIINKKFKSFKNFNINNTDQTSFKFYYMYTLTDSRNNKIVSQLPQNIYKLAMQPTCNQDIFGPLQKTCAWPGSSLFSREYFFKGSNTK